MRRANMNHAGVPAAWFRLPFKTPVRHVYAFANQDDDFSSWTAVQSQLWKLMRLPGPVTSVDKVGWPYNGSHMLVTVRHTALKLRSHDLAIMDQATPLGAGGAPVFAPVWRYACFP